MVERSEIFSNDKIGKILKPSQRIIIFGAIVASILLMIYSFIFMTPFADLYQIDGVFHFHKMSQFGLSMIEGLSPRGTVNPYVYGLTSGDIIGMNLAYFTDFTKVELQIFNKWMFALAFFGIIASLIPLIYGSQKRKIYYKTNLVVNPAVATFNLYIGIHMLVQLIMNQILVWNQNYEIINAYQTYIEDNTATQIKTFFRKSDSNGMFAFGYIIAFAIIAFAVLTIVLTVVKYKHQKKQPQIDLSKVKIHE